MTVFYLQSKTIPLTKHSSVYNGGIIGAGKRKSTCSVSIHVNNITSNTKQLIRVMKACCASHTDVNKQTEISQDSIIQVSLLLVQYVSPDVMYNGLPWPEEEFSKVNSSHHDIHGVLKPDVFFVGYHWEGFVHPSLVPKHPSAVGLADARGCLSTRFVLLFRVDQGADGDVVASVEQHGRSEQVDRGWELQGPHEYHNQGHRYHVFGTVAPAPSFWNQGRHDLFQFIRGKRISAVNNFYLICCM